VTPAVLAILAWAVWGTLAMGVVILTSYGLPSPAGDRAGPHVLTACIAALVMLVLAIRHSFRRHFPLSRCIAEVMVITAAFMLVVPVWMLLSPMPSHRIISFSGQTYAVPRGYDYVEPAMPLRDKDAHRLLSAAVCTLGPAYPFGPCDQRTVYVLSTNPTYDYLSIRTELNGADVILQDGKVIFPGQAKLSGTDIHIETEHVLATLQTDAEGVIRAWRSCSKGEDTSCMAGLRLEDGLSVSFGLRPDSTPEAERAVFDSLLAQWRCPEAEGCVKKD